ncbi:MAG: hypothetical protein ACHQIK_22795 [Candidatus Acidiferrales bacterium]
MSEPNQKRTAREKNESQVNVHGAIEVHPPESLLKQHNAERKEDSATHIAERKKDWRRETKKMLLELGTLLAVVVYAGIAAWQACLTRTAITDAQKHFVMDHACPN